jgi:hypothetical protein
MRRASSYALDVFRSTDHLKVIKEVKAELKLRNAAKSESKMSCDNHRTILGGKETGQWLSVPVNGTELSAQELRDALLLRYARSSATAASRSLAFAMRMNASEAVS